MNDVFRMDAAALVALVFGMLFILVAAVRMMPTGKRPTPARGRAHHSPEARLSEVRGFLVTLSAALRSSEGANSSPTNLTPDALDETRRRVALVAAPSRLHDIDTNAHHPFPEKGGRMSSKMFERTYAMVREGHELLEQGRLKEGARLLIDATAAAESAATGDHTDARPHWLLAFAWFGLGSAAERGNDTIASAVSYRRAFFRMAKACERQLLLPNKN